MIVNTYPKLCIRNFSNETFSFLEIYECDVKTSNNFLPRGEIQENIWHVAVEYNIKMLSR